LTGSLLGFSVEVFSRNLPISPFLGYYHSSTWRFPGIFH
jgi:hypothetical protein